MKLRVALALTLALWGCGGGSKGGPTAPNPVSAPDNGIPAGTRLTVVSGETSAPVAGAQVVVGGRTLSADSSGQVALAERMAPGGPIDVVASGFLDRITLLRSATETRFTLWPKTSPTGLDEDFTAHIVYTNGDVLGDQPLTRLGDTTRRVDLVLAPELADDDAVLARHELAAAQITAAAGGQIAYVLGQANPGGVTVDVSFDPEDEECDATTRAVTYTQSRSGAIVGARIVYCVADAERASTVTHELGHTFGLGHSPDEREVMGAFFSRSRANDFSARESLAMQLMLLRRPGNRHPDNDRDMGTAQTSGFSGTLVTICR